ncbi:hypothetical protein LINPERHAP1_LOCUS137 [Linum perenne]
MELWLKQSACVGGAVVSEIWRERFKRIYSEPNTILADVDSVFLAMVVEDETLYCIWDGVMGAGKLLECCYAAAGGLLSEICY